MLTTQKKDQHRAEVRVTYAEKGDPDERDRVGRGAGVFSDAPCLTNVPRRATMSKCTSCEVESTQATNWSYQRLSTQQRLRTDCSRTLNFRTTSCSRALSSGVDVDDFR